MAWSVEHLGSSDCLLDGRGNCGWLITHPTPIPTQGPTETPSPTQTATHSSSVSSLTADLGLIKSLYLKKKIRNWLLTDYGFNTKPRTIMTPTYCQRFSRLRSRPKRGAGTGTHGGTHWAVQASSAGPDAPGV